MRIRDLFLLDQIFAAGDPRAEWAPETRNLERKGTTATPSRPTPSMRIKPALIKHKSFPLFSLSRFHYLG